jgi:hypothetical protein
MTPCWLDILDTLEALGPMTTAELAEETGRDAEHIGSACTQLAEATTGTIRSHAVWLRWAGAPCGRLGSSMRWRRGKRSRPRPRLGV